MLGLLGVGEGIYGALTRPGVLVHETPGRFGVVLVECFVAPILAVMLVSAHMYSGWRHLYFLYVPFSVLAVYGLRRDDGLPPEVVACQHVWSGDVRYGIGAA